MRLAPLLAGLLAAAGPAAVQPAAAQPAAARPAAAQPAAAPAASAAAPALGDPCRAGLAHERSGALPRAFVELSRCTANAEASAALGRVKKKLAAGKYAPVAFSLTPAQAAVRVAPFTDGAPLREPHALWLPFGTHTYVASASGHSEVRGVVVVDSPARILLQVELEPLEHARPPRAVDFEADGPAVDEPIVVADPRPKKHRSLIPERFRGGLDDEHGSRPRGEVPSARRGQPAARASRRPDFSWPWILTWGM